MLLLLLFSPPLLGDIQPYSSPSKEDPSVASRDKEGVSVDSLQLLLLDPIHVCLAVHEACRLMSRELTLCFLPPLLFCLLYILLPSFPSELVSIRPYPTFFPSVFPRSLPSYLQFSPLSFLFYLIPLLSLFPTFSSFHSSLPSLLPCFLPSSLLYCFPSFIPFPLRFLAGRS